jgi:flavin-dependent dehydrogenase
METMENQSKYTEPTKELAVYGTFDVIVVGGGAAGFASAIASARMGAKTLIIERFPYFGGTATASLMTNINGYRNQVEPDGLQTSKGIAEEVILRLKEIGGLGKSGYKQREYPTTKGNLSFSYAIDSEKFKYMTLKMVVEAGVKILFHTYFADVIKEGNKVTGVIFENKSGRQAAFGKVIIDASGDGDVAARAGAAFWKTDPEKEPRLQDGLMYKVVGYPKEHSIKGCDAYGSLTLWGPRMLADATDADQLTDEEIKLRLAIYDDLEAQKKKFPELKDARIVETGPLVGIRQSRFIEGLYKMTLDDVLTGRRFEDSIAMASKPIIKYFGYRRFLEHEGYDIPYRCLVPKEISCLYIAGRCMSSDQPAYESWRSISPCMCLGEACGTAAALCVQTGADPHHLDVPMLQKKLIEQGAEIGQNRKQ